MSLCDKLKRDEFALNVAVSFDILVIEFDLAFETKYKTINYLKSAFHWSLILALLYYIYRISHETFSTPTTNTENIYTHTKTINFNLLCHQNHKRAVATVQRLSSFNSTFDR